MTSCAPQRSPRRTAFWCQKVKSEKAEKIINFDSA
uniref:Uncharacterized protein n=1 Tax=Triticum urartu TaxID=4572 RepID=A0A8R7K0N9_TRIUA